MNNQILLTGGCGQGRKGFLNIIRYGLKLRPVVSINCSAPHGIWTVKKNVNDKYHSFVVITYNQSRKTLTFHIENNKLVQSNDLRLSEGDLTIHITRFGDNSLVQVSPFKIRYTTREGISK